MVYDFKERGGDQTINQSLVQRFPSSVFVPRRFCSQVIIGCEVRGVSAVSGWLVRLLSTWRCSVVTPRIRTYTYITLTKNIFIHLTRRM